MGCGKMINIIYEDNHLLVVEKPRNMLVQGDNTKYEDMIMVLKKYLKEKYNKPNNVYLGLVHRLDRPVGGVMVFAKTSKCASRLSEEIRTRCFNKTYLAVVCGKVKSSGVFEDYIKKDESVNKSKIDKNGKYAKLDYKLISKVENLNLVKINLETGRKHQIRLQFASRGFPLWGDQKYNNKALVGEQIALWAYEISFKHPITKEIMCFKCEPKWCEYPWNLFGGHNE